MGAKDLFHHNQFALIAFTRNIETGKVDTAGQISAAIVTTIPDDLVPTFVVLSLEQIAHQLSPLIVDFDLYLAGFIHAIADGGLWVKGIGIGITETGNRGYMHRASIGTIKMNVDRAKDLAGAVKICAQEPVAIETRLKDLAVIIDVAFGLRTICPGNIYIEIEGVFEDIRSAPIEAKALHIGLGLGLPHQLDRASLMHQSGERR